MPTMQRQREVQKRARRRDRMPSVQRNRQSRSVPVGQVSLFGLVDEAREIFGDLIVAEGSIENAEI